MRIKAGKLRLEACEQIMRSSDDALRQIRESVRRVASEQQPPMAPVSTGRLAGEVDLSRRSRPPLEIGQFQQKVEGLGK